MAVPSVEFVGRPAQGRTYRGRQRVRLGDTDQKGALRLDALVRYLQDVATDDWDEAAVDPDAIWVVRRTGVRLADGGRWPRLGEFAELITWCSGLGAAWAERRTDVVVDGVVLVQAVALWVPLTPSFQPRRIDDGFRTVYGEAAGGRKVSGRVPLAAVDGEAASFPWPLRRVDLDVAGHVNNAACWEPVVEAMDRAGAASSAVEVIHHASLEWGSECTVVTSLDRCWLVVAGSVIVSAQWSRAAD